MFDDGFGVLQEISALCYFIAFFSLVTAFSTTIGTGIILIRIVLDQKNALDRNSRRVNRNSGPAAEPVFAEN